MKEFREEAAGYSELKGKGGEEDSGGHTHTHTHTNSLHHPGALSCPHVLHPIQRRKEQERGEVFQVATLAGLKESEGTGKQ